MLVRQAVLASTACRARNDAHVRQEHGALSLTIGPDKLTLLSMRVFHNFETLDKLPIREVRSWRSTP